MHAHMYTHVLTPEVLVGHACRLVSGCVSKLKLGIGWSTRKALQRKLCIKQQQQHQQKTLTATTITSSTKTHCGLWFSLFHFISFHSLLQPQQKGAALWILCMFESTPGLVWPDRAMPAKHNQPGSQPTSWLECFGYCLHVVDFCFSFFVVAAFVVFVIIFFVAVFFCRKALPILISFRSVPPFIAQSSAVQLLAKCNERFHVAHWCVEVIVEDWWKSKGRQTMR